MSLSTCHYSLYLHFWLFCRVLIAFFKTVQCTDVSQRRLCTFCKNWWKTLPHRVGRVLSFFSSRQNWDSPNPLPAGESAPPPLIPRGGAHSLARKGVGESQFRRGDIHCGTLYMYVLCALLPRHFHEIPCLGLVHSRSDAGKQRYKQMTSCSTFWVFADFTLTQI
jgi:hypothetical protein